ncbi:MAG: hypothetical protein Q9226_003955 [Calogaya cf. arnoldii]
MPNFFMRALLGIATICTAAVIPTTTEPSGRTFSVNGPSNLTTGLKTVDPHFTGYVFDPGSESLKLDDGLMALTKMMHRLSGRYFNGMMGPETWVAAGYTSVSVEVRVGPGREVIPTRFAIWGAQQLGVHIISHRQVRNLVWALVWMGSVVGSIEIKRKSPQLLLPGSGGGGTSDRMPVVPGLDFILDKQLRATDASGDKRKDLTIGLPPLQDDRKESLTYHVIDDRPMTKWELFANIYSFLGHVSEHPPRRKILPYFAVTPSLFPDTYFQLLAVKDGEVEYGFLADAAISTAFFILRQNVFSTLLLRLRLDEEVVCQCLIYKGEIPRPQGSGT